MPARASARIAASRGSVSLRGVAEVGQQREVDVRIDVAERLHLEVREQFLDPRRRCRASSGRSPSCARRPGRDRTRAAAAGAAESGS